MYIMLLKVFSSSFSAVAACTLNWLMVHLSKNKDELLDATAPAVKCGQ